jgi:hypothetical protein
MEFPVLVVRLHVSDTFAHPICKVFCPFFMFALQTLYLFCLLYATFRRSASPKYVKPLFEKYGLKPK